MPLQQLFTSRKPYDAETFVAGEGKLFFDESSGLLRLGDDVTPGGKIVGNLAIAAYGTTPPNNPYPGELWYNPTTKELWAYYNGEFRGTINQATETVLGGVRLGPGVITNSEGQIIIDSSGLDFSFGDFSSLTEAYPAGHPKEGTDYAVLKTVNLNEDAVLASNGTGAIKVVGEFRIYPTNGTIGGSMLQSPVFAVGAEGDITASSLDIQETSDLGLMAALNVTINEAGLTKTPTVVTGSVAQFTGRDSRASIILVDSYGIDVDRSITGGELTFRTGRGTNASTTAVQSGDRLGLVTAAGWASNGYGGVGVAGLRIHANENFTSTARGSRLEFFVVPNGTITPVTVATINSGGIVLTTGTVLTGNVTGNVNATSITATNITVTGNVTGNVTATNITASSLVVGNTIRYDVTQNNGTATQLTSKSTTVVCNGRTGQIVTSNSSLAKGSAVTFTVTNNAVTAVTDVPVAVIQSGASIDSYSISVTRVQVGSFNITLTNNGTGPLAETLIINFAIVKVS